MAVYKEQSSAWYDYKTNEEIINIQFYKNIITSIGICGLAGLDKLIGFMIVAEIMVNIISIVSTSVVINWVSMGREGVIKYLFLSQSRIICMHNKTSHS